MEETRENNIKAKKQELSLMNGSLYRKALRPPAIGDPPSPAPASAPASAPVRHPLSP